MSYSSWLYGLQHARLLCPPLSPKVCSNWCQLMLLNYLILCRPLLLLPSIFHGNTVFSNESALCIKWPNSWSFKFSISPFNEYSGLISFRTDWFVLLVVQGLSRVFSSTTIQDHQFIFVFFFKKILMFLFYFIF